MENINILVEKELRDILKKYDYPRSAILPMLHFIQKKYGSISKKDVEIIADLIGINPTEIESVLSFYSMFNTGSSAKYIIYACSNISCEFKGAGEIITFLENRLHIKVGQTTGDGKFALRTVECLAACSHSPVIQINDIYYEHMTIEKMEKIISEMEK
jgi:NADH-quinone oxidoreductase E subunit